MGGRGRGEPEVAVAQSLQAAGVVADTVLAVTAVAAPPPRARVLATLGALALTPLLLAADASATGRLHELGRRPGEVAAIAALALVAVGAGAVVFARRPALLALAAATAMPFRVPLSIGGDTANLLVPLYGVIAAGALGLGARSWRGARAEPARPATPWRPAPSERERRAARPQLHALHWLLLGFILLYAIQATYSSDLPTAVTHVAFFYVPFALLFGLLSELDWTPWLLRACLGVLVALALLFCAVGFVQYATRTVWLNEKLMTGNAYTPYFRVNSLFFDPNIYGRFLAVVALGVAALVVWASRRREVAAGGAVLAVLWLGLLTTRSESSFSALLLGIAVLVVLRAPLGRLAIAGAAVVACAAAVVLLLLSGVLAGSANERSSLRQATSGRSDLLSGGFDLFTARPVLGWGSGAFAREYERHKEEPSARAVSASHTIPLTVAAEQGIVGLAAYLALLVVAFRVLLRRARDSLPRAAVGAAFAALVLHTLLYAAFLEDPLAWALLAVGAALAQRSSWATSLSPTWRWLA